MDIRNFTPEEQGGVFVNSLKVGDTWTMGSKSYTVTSVGKKIRRICIRDSHGAERKLTIKSMSWCFYGNFSTEQFFRDLDGEILLDLINENNPFHEQGFVTTRIRKSIKENITEN